jgi:hypothetical protein
VWDFKLRRELNGLADFIYAIRSRIVLKMEDENRWKRLEKLLLARLARAGISDSQGLRQRDVCECTLNSMYRIVLREEFGF